MPEASGDTTAIGGSTTTTELGETNATNPIVALKALEADRSSGHIVPTLRRILCVQRSALGEAMLVSNGPLTDSWFSSARVVFLTTSVGGQNLVIGSDLEGRAEHPLCELGIGHNVLGCALAICPTQLDKAKIIRRKQIPGIHGALVGSVSMIYCGALVVARHEQVIHGEGRCKRPDTGISLVFNGFIRRSRKGIASDEAEAAPVRGDIGHQVTQAPLLVHRIAGGTNTTIAEGVDGTNEGVLGGILAAKGDSAEATGQTGIGLAGGATKNARIASYVTMQTVFKYEYGLQAVAQVFRSLEAKAVGFGDVGVDTATALDVIVNMVTQIGKAIIKRPIQGHVRLRESRSGQQTDDGQRDQSLLHEILLRLN